jgi:hypothetical protein
MSVYERVARMASGNAVVVFRASGCCMCHVVKRLLLGLGVGPTVYELDQMVVGFGSGCGGREIQAALAQLLPLGQPPVPVVFVGEVPGAITGAAAPPPSTVSTSTVLPPPPRHCRRRRRLAGCWSTRIWFSEEAQKRKGGRAGARAACSAGLCLGTRQASVWALGRLLFGHPPRLREGEAAGEVGRQWGGGSGSHG